MPSRARARFAGSLIRCRRLLLIEICGERVPLSRGSHIRDWLVYQGRDDFELREDGPDRWLLSQSAEWDDHDPSHVGRSAALQAAAEDFTRSVTRRRPATGRAERDARL